MELLSDYRNIYMTLREYIGKGEKTRTQVIHQIDKYGYSKKARKLQQLVDEGFLIESEDLTYTVDIPPPSPYSAPICQNHLEYQKRDLAEGFTDDELFSYVCDFFEVEEDDVRGKRRKRELVLARHTFWYVMRKYKHHTLKYIAWQWGKRDHSTVIHAVKSISDLIDVDKPFNRRINRLFKFIEDKI